MFWRVAGGVVFAMACLVSAARAHGGVRIEKGQCVLKIGPDLMNFSGYQPLQATQQFCEDIPALGRTIIVLDAVDSELRDMTTELRIVKDVGGGIFGKARVLSDEELSSDDLDPTTVAHLPAKRYPTGTVQLEHVFSDAGYYIGVVTARNDHGQFYVSQFPFSVGRGWIKTAGFYALLIAGVLGGAFLYWKFQVPRPAAVKK